MDYYNRKVADSFGVLILIGVVIGTILSIGVFCWVTK